MDLYTGPALAEKAGATYRQIEYWTNRGYLKPLPIRGGSQRGSGNTRLYSDHHIRQVRILAALLNSETVAEVAAALNERGVIYLPHGITLRLDEREARP